MITLKDKRDVLNSLIASDAVPYRDKEVLQLILDEDLESVVGEVNWDAIPDTNEPLNTHDKANYLISLEEANERKADLFYMWFKSCTMGQKGEAKTCMHCGVLKYPLITHHGKTYCYSCAFNAFGFKSLYCKTCGKLIATLPEWMCPNEILFSPIHPWCEEPDED